MSITFYSKSPDYAWLSNFSAHPFENDGVRWRSVEHYYQAQKFPGTEHPEKIRELSNAPAARSYAQNRALTPRADWDAVKEDVMRRALDAKFRQNRKLGEQLLATGDEALIHHSTSDSYWGTGRDGDGQNRLGVLLMELRALLLRESAPE